MTIALIHAAAVRPGRDAPGLVVPNESFAELHAELCERLVQDGHPAPAPMDPAFPLERAGVRRRGVLDGAWTVRDLAVEAGRRVLHDAGVDPERIVAVVTSTTAAEDPIPSLSASVHGALGLVPSAAAIDVALGCTGFVGATELAAARLANHAPGALALVIGAEAMLRVVDAADRSTAVLFGDGAGAVLLERLPGETPPITSWTTLGRQWQDIHIRPDPDVSRPVYRLVTDGVRARIEVDRRTRTCLTMRGRTVFRDVVRSVPAAIDAHLRRAGTAVDTVDLFALHQANARMLTSIRDDERLCIAPERMPITVGDDGNTSSASIPIVLADAFASATLPAPGTVVLAGFGAGLAIAVTSLPVHPIRTTPAPRT